MIDLLNEHKSRQNHRYVVGLADGARVESVVYRGDTLCVSSQVGCAVACPFCASGARGFGRNLELPELIGQLDAALDRGHPIARVTLSGVGEPLHNFDHARTFLEHCRARRIKASLTTSGGPLSRLAEALTWHHNGLTLSVHAGTEPTRARLVPNAPSLDGLFGVLTEVVPTLSASKRKKTALAYLLMAGDNDSDAEVDAFAARARALGLTVHLYAYNPVPSSDRKPIARARYDALWARLTARGLRVRMSSTARIEQNGGCGTLVALRTDARAAAAP
ncbi:MAG: radical SAM protein [Myxococcales bacterium]|nr:radical SAM protein [Myxococcales bacterium]